MDLSSHVCIGCPYVLWFLRSFVSLLYSNGLLEFERPLARGQELLTSISSLVSSHEEDRSASLGALESLDACLC